MVGNLLWLILIPVIWGFVAKLILKHEITWKEFGVKTGIITVILMIIYGTMMYQNTTDTLVVNGEVVSKAKVRVSCSHSYDCFCVTTCNGKGSCSRSCQTCYEHSNDWDWEVKTTVGNFDINRIDRQGNREPPRWTQVLIGEPASRQQSYTNYVMASPQSLFNMALVEADSSKYQMPAYPGVFDYYRIKRVLLTNGAQVPNVEVWNTLLNESLRKLGPKKQANIVLVFSKGYGQEYARVIERNWIGGKKNDIVIVVGLTGDKFDWVDVFTFGKTSGNTELSVQLRDKLMEIGTIGEPVKGAIAISSMIDVLYKRKEMAEYEYLKSEAGLSDTQTKWLMGILVFMLLSGTFVVWKYDLFAERFSHYNFRRNKW